MTLRSEAKVFNRLLVSTVSEVKEKIRKGKGRKQKEIELVQRRSG